MKAHSVDGYFMASRVPVSGQPFRWLAPVAQSSMAPKGSSKIWPKLRYL